MKKTAAIKKDNQEGHLWTNQAQDTVFARKQDYMTQVSVETLGIQKTKKVSRELSKTETSILGAITKLDEFRRNQGARTYSAPIPKTSRKSNRENQGTNEDHSQNDIHPDVVLSLNQSFQDIQDINPGKTSYTNDNNYIF